jgi:hypothetical protein
MSVTKKDSVKLCVLFVVHSLVGRLRANLPQIALMISIHNSQLNADQPVSKANQ